MDREAWCVVIHGVAKSRTRLSEWSDLIWSDGFISVLSILFHWATSVFCASTILFWLLQLRSTFRSHKVLYIQLYSFFLKFTLTIQGLLSFHTNFKIIFLQLCEKYSGYFDRDCITSVDSFREYGYFNNINSSNQRVEKIFKFFHQCFIVFRAYIFYFFD